MITERKLKMDDKDLSTKILNDLSERKLEVASFICMKQNGKLLVISYGDDGLVSFLSETGDNLSVISWRKSGGYRTIADIGTEKVESK